MAKAKKKGKSKPKAKGKVKAKAKSKVKAKAKANAKPKAKAKAKAKVKAKKAARVEAKAEKKVKAKAEKKVEAKAEKKIEAKAEPKPEPVAAPKPEPKAEAKAEAKVRPIPAGYHTFTPYLVYDDCAAAIEFYKKGLGAAEIMRMPRPDGKIMHAEIRIGDSNIFVTDYAPEQQMWKTPTALGSVSCTFYLYVEGVDAVHARAVEAGAKENSPPADMFYGDRVSQITDPFGYVWHLGTHVKDVTPEEMMQANPMK